MSASATKVVRRKAANVFFEGFCFVVTVLALVALAAILWSLLSQGIGGLNLDIFTLSTPAPGSRGGLANAIVGSLMMCALAMVFALVIGVLGGTWLAEYGGRSAYGGVVRFINDVLLSAPSILVGLFVYELIVAPMHGFSGFAGSVALALLAAPVIMRTTEDVLLLQAATLREAGVALGAPLSLVIREILWRSASSGLLTGALLAFARISGETAPLLFTALNNQFFSLNMTKPTANLPVVIFNYALSAYDDWRRLAWAGALLIAGAVLTVTIIARIVAKEQRRFMNTLQTTETFETSLTPIDAAQVKISIRNLDFFYGKTRSLKSVTMPIAANKVTALIGPSGCGKSTLLRTLNRMYALYPGQRAEGEIVLDGENVLGSRVDLARLRARVGMVFQKPTPFPMSIYDNVAYGVRLYENLSKADMDGRVEEALTRSALWDEVKDKLRESGLGLSGGQQQRLCVARGVAVRPEVLLLDEPTSALDPISSAKLEETVTQLKADHTIVIVTHNLGQAARVSDHTGFMYLGELVEFGPTDQVFTRPATSRTSDYITGRFG